MRSEPVPATSPPRPPPTLRGIVGFVQPIVHLASGRVVGFEALARLQIGDALLAPAAFVPALSPAQRLTLFAEMLAQATAFVGRMRPRYPDLSVSVNVETSLLLGQDFCNLVEAIVPRTCGAPVLYLEMLESEQIVDFERTLAVMTRLRRRGIGLSLDDVGSGYASLSVIKRLPVDVMKLDRSFARELPSKPDDLQFVRSLVSLAIGLGKVLVVEGVETAAIRDALAIIGVDRGQGYAIARPMPIADAPRWLESYRAVPLGRTPRSMLGAYAAHLNIVEADRLLTLQSLPIRWRDEAKDPHACGIGRYFDGLGCHCAPHGLAHKRFHSVIDRLGAGDGTWERAAREFRAALQVEILAEAGLTEEDCAARRA